MSHISDYIHESMQILHALDQQEVDGLIDALIALRARKGRLFILGVGGSAANASHAVNDFRKICGIETYAPTDNVAELTARINDDGWDSCFVDWLRASHFGENDAVLVFSVGGGGSAVSVCVSRAVEFAAASDGLVLGIVGRDGGITRKHADACILIPLVRPERVTFHTEGITAVLWHLAASDPRLQIAPTRWESFDAAP